MLRGNLKSSPAIARQKLIAGTCNKEEAKFSAVLTGLYPLWILPCLLLFQARSGNASTDEPRRIQVVAGGP
jgi:hypothetical protein